MLQQSIGVSCTKILSSRTEDEEVEEQEPV
jgi:hypothetical protein